MDKSDKVFSFIVLVIAVVGTYAIYRTTEYEQKHYKELKQHTEKCNCRCHND